MRNKKHVKLAIVQKQFSHYRKGIFDRLNNDYQFILITGNEKSSVKQSMESEYVRKVFSFNYWKKRTNIFLNVLPEIRRFKADVVIHEFTPSILSLFFVLFFKKVFRYKLILWGHGFNMSIPLEQQKFKLAVRKYFIKKSDAVLLYNEDNRKILNEIYPSEKYFVAYNSLDTEKSNKILTKLDEIGKPKIKEDLNFGHEHILIFVGRLIERKILHEQFVEVIRNVQNKVNDVGIIIIGDGPSRDSLEKQMTRSNIKNSTFLGSIYDEFQLAKYLYISDLLLMPGYVGLAVNHAFAYRTPAVTFQTGKRGPFHSPEIEYLENYKTGYKAKSYDTDDMVRFVTDFLNHKDSNQTIYEYEISKMTARKCNINRMKSGFDSAIDYVLRS